MARATARRTRTTTSTTAAAAANNVPETFALCLLLLLLTSSATTTTKTTTSSTAVVFVQSLQQVQVAASRLCSDTSNNRSGRWQAAPSRAAAAMTATDRKDDEVETKESPPSVPVVRSVYKALTKQIDERIRIAETNGRRVMEDGPEALEPIKLSELLLWASSSGGVGDDDTSQCAVQQVKQRKLLLERGFCVVEIDNREDASKMESMWKYLGEIFGDGADPDNDKTTGGSESFQLYHQSQLRSDDDDDGGGGYEYVHLSLNDTPMEKSRMTVAETDDRVAATDATSPPWIEPFELLGTIGRAFCATAYASAIAITPSSTSCDSNEVIDHLIHDTEDNNGSTRHFSNSFQRLALYKDNVEGESLLGAHTDWSLCTLVPVSSIPGLEIYDPRDGGRWYGPEQHFSNNKGKPHRRYVAVLAGKWLEILTGGTVRAVIHSVTAPSFPDRKSDIDVVGIATSRRPSAPFFLRVRESLMNCIEERFGSLSQGGEIDDDNLHNALDVLKSLLVEDSESGQSRRVGPGRPPFAKGRNTSIRSRMVEGVRSSPMTIRQMSAGNRAEDTDNERMEELKQESKNLVKVLGIGGGIGSGKSSACKLLVSDLGCIAHIGECSLRPKH